MFADFFWDADGPPRGGFLDRAMLLVVTGGSPCPRGGTCRSDTVYWWRRLGLLVVWPIAPGPACWGAYRERDAGAFERRLGI